MFYKLTYHITNISLMSSNKREARKILDFFLYIVRQKQMLVEQ